MPAPDPEVIAFLHTEAPSDTEPCAEMQISERISDLDLWRNVIGRTLTRAGLYYLPATVVEIAQSMLAFHEELNAGKKTVVDAAERSKSPPEERTEPKHRPPTDAEELLNELSFYLRDLLMPQREWSESNEALGYMMVAIDTVLGRRRLKP
jgi:hypothetical protein